MAQRFRSHWDSGSKWLHRDTPSTSHGVLSRLINSPHSAIWWLFWESNLKYRLISVVSEMLSRRHVAYQQNIPKGRSKRLLPRPVIILRISACVLRHCHSGMTSGIRSPKLKKALPGHHHVEFYALSIGRLDGCVTGIIRSRLSLRVCPLMSDALAVQLFSASVCSLYQNFSGVRLNSFAILFHRVEALRRVTSIRQP